MTIREQIIEQLDVSPIYQGEYNKLKLCLKTKEGIIDSNIDLWFEGIIQSLFYKPNHYLLVIESSDESLVSTFFEKMFPENFPRFSIGCGYIDHLKNCLYDYLLYHISFDYQKQQDIIEEDNFIVLEENAKQLKEPGTDKRLCSYCTTTQKWRYPQRKNVIVLSLESIDWELYNSIDKLELWREIFFKFKP